MTAAQGTVSVTTFYNYQLNLLCQDDSRNVTQENDPPLLLHILINQMLAQETLLPEELRFKLKKTMKGIVLV